MTVKKLISNLSKEPEDNQVYVWTGREELPVIGLDKNWGCKSGYTVIFILLNEEDYTSEWCSSTKD